MAKKLSETEKAEATEVVVVNPLELKVTKNVVGVLETNIEQLENYVNSKLEEYKPELYMGDADMARKDRAELNNSKKFLANARINLMRELMKPYTDFENRCKALERKIDEASGQLDVIVKTKEDKERAQKKLRCEELWLAKNFELFPLDKVFNPKWLNKTAKENDISAEMDSIIERTYKDLKTIERYGTDADTLKAHYLISLDIGETLDYGEELEKQREIAEREKAERADREHNAQLKKQENEVRLEALNKVRNEGIEEAALYANHMTKEDVNDVKEFVVTIKATDDQLHKLKMACNALRIEYSVEELTF